MLFLLLILLLIFTTKSWRTAHVYGSLTCYQIHADVIIQYVESPFYCASYHLTVDRDTSVYWGQDTGFLKNTKKKCNCLCKYCLVNVIYVCTRPSSALASFFTLSYILFRPLKPTQTCTVLDTHSSHMLATSEIPFLPPLPSEGTTSAKALY